jgi:D-3-phosphoglycerate dehydrogenase
MNRFPVALVAVDAPEVPGWIDSALRAENIDLAISECKTTDDVIRNAAAAKAVWLFGGSRVLTPEGLRRLPNCEAIVRSGSGTDNVPVKEATDLGILVVNTPEATSDAVADHAISLMLGIERQLMRHDRLIRSGVWGAKRYWPETHMSGKTLGLVGFGTIAQAVAHKLRGFEMKVLASDPLVPAETITSQGAIPATLEDVLSQSDFVSIHCPLTDSTRHLISERELRLMKPNAVLINTSRGGVVDTDALVRAVQEKWIWGAGLDVLEPEPPSMDHPVFSLENVVITPHVAGYSDQFWEKMWRLSVESLVDLSRGRWPRSCLNRGGATRFVAKS